VTIEAPGEPAPPTALTPPLPVDVTTVDEALPSRERTVMLRPLRHDAYDGVACTWPLAAPTDTPVPPALELARSSPFGPTLMDVDCASTLVDTSASPAVKIRNFMRRGGCGSGEPHPIP